MNNNSQEYHVNTEIFFFRCLTRIYLLCFWKHREAILIFSCHGECNIPSRTWASIDSSHSPGMKRTRMFSPGGWEGAGSPGNNLLRTFPSLIMQILGNSGLQWEGSALSLISPRTVSTVTPIQYLLPWTQQGLIKNPVLHLDSILFSQTP